MFIVAIATQASTATSSNPSTSLTSDEPMSLAATHPNLLPTVIQSVCMV